LPFLSTHFLKTAAGNSQKQRLSYPPKPPNQPTKTNPEKQPEKTQEASNFSTVTHVTRCNMVALQYFINNISIVTL